MAKPELPYSDVMELTAKAQQLYVIQASSNGTLTTTLRLYSGSHQPHRREHQRNERGVYHRSLNVLWSAALRRNLR